MLLEYTSKDVHISWEYEVYAPDRDGFRNEPEIDISNIEVNVLGIYVTPESVNTKEFIKWCLTYTENILEQQKEDSTLRYVE